VTADPAPRGPAANRPVTLSTHVLDAVAGRPAADVAVRLEYLGPDGWSPAGQGRTSADGRLALDGRAGGRPGPGFAPGVYRITFGSGPYFQALGTPSFYPEVTITFEMTSGSAHYHVPLLLSPFAYSTYRGS